MMYSAQKKLSQSFFIILTILILVYTFTSQISAYGGFESARDVINDNTVNATNVEHTIMLQLPDNSQMISSGDYIIISLPAFFDVTVADQLSGDYFGTPTFTLDGNDIKITGIAVLPGNAIQILGITATNPPIESDFEVIISVTEDEDGAIIRNIQRVIASTFSGNVGVTATLSAPVSSVTFSGNTAIGSIVTITEGGSVIGTDTAGGSLGAFAKYITGIEPDTHLFTIYGIDQQNRVTSPVNVEIYTPIYQNTSVSNILLSPTIQISSDEITQGDSLIASGSAIPGGSISLFTESPLRTYYASAGAMGLWSYTIATTSSYTPGDYRIYSLVQNSGGSQSLFSTALQFTVLSTSASSGSTACDISKGDLNCDTNINLTDFSILMYYWGTSSVTADINSDNSVNLTDFSIMMYYWGT